jgi:hypothetical protein
MCSESVCQVTRSWVDVGSFQTRLAVRFIVYRASVPNILDSLDILRVGYIACVLCQLAESGMEWNWRSQLTQH